MGSAEPSATPVGEPRRKIVKFWLAFVRGEDRYSRITLDVDFVPGVKDEHNSEADVATRNLLALAPLVPVHKPRSATRS